MQVIRSGYYRYIKSVRRVNMDRKLRLVIEVKALHKQSDQSYGSRRMSKALQAKGYEVGRFKARHLMREANIACKQRRRFKVTTQSNPLLPVAAVTAQFN